MILTYLHQEHQNLVEALHREVQRRQKALGPGATSAMEALPEAKDPKDPGSQLPTDVG